MSAIELLEEQHEEVDTLFQEFEEAADDEERRTLFKEIADTLAAHATIEERLFYPAAYVGELKPLLREAVEEHLAVKRVIADLLDMDPSNEQFIAKMKVLREQVQHHVEEEEGELFPKVREAIDEDGLEALGESMEQMFEELLEGEPSTGVPSETRAAAPLGKKRPAARN